MINPVLQQQELRETLDLLQKFTKENFSLVTALWNAWIFGILGDEENMLRIVLEVLLFASQDNAEGQALFINALEYSKNKYPHLVDELWEAYDNWDNLHKTDFFRIVE